MAMTTARTFTPSTSSNSVNSRTLSKADCASNDSFPAGLRVLVVDDDPICLLILDRMLRRCQYKVTTCGRAADALAMLRENRDSFDVIISDVYMPDMDGFKLLELVGLEMDLPVIMMSANGETSAVMKGIKHGACDYLLKPVRMEELRNIWQHVVRKKWRSSVQQVAFEDEKGKHAFDDEDHHSSANEGYDGTWKQGKKRRDLKEEEEEADLDPDDPSATKKPRVVWSVELHQQFVNAVNQLGIDKAVPKRILELMNVHGLTRENVASHLQKYRLYLKRISGVAHQSGTLSPFPVSNDSSYGPSTATGLGGAGDFRGLGGPNELSSQTLLSSLQAGVLERLNPANNLSLGNVEKSNLLQLAALQGAGSGALNRPPFRPSYGQPVLNDQAVLQAGQCDANPVQLAHMGALPGLSLDKLPLGLSALQQQQQLETAVGFGGLGQLSGVGSNCQQVNSSTNTLLMQALQQQQQEQQQQVGGGHMLSKSGLTIATSTNAGQQGLSTDAGVWATAISNLNGNIRIGNALPGQYGASSRLGSIPGTYSGSAGQGPLGRVSDRECRGQQGLSTDAGVWGASLSHLNATSVAGNGFSGQNNGLLEFGSADSAGLGSSERVYDGESKSSLMPNAGNVLLVNPLAVSSSMSGPDVLLYSRMKDVNSLLPPLTAPQNLGSRFTGLKQVPLTGQRAQGTWPGFSLGQEYGQVSNSAMQSPGCSIKGSSSNQGMPFVSDQDQGDLCGSGFNSGFANNFNIDANSVKAFQHEQLGADICLNGKNEDQGWVPEPLSDELLSIVLRQQQEGLGLTE